MCLCVSNPSSISGCLLSDLPLPDSGEEMLPSLSNDSSFNEKTFLCARVHVCVCVCVCYARLHVHLKEHLLLSLESFCPCNHNAHR